MTAISDLDYGTPARVSQRTVTLTIDGVPVSVPEGHVRDARRRGAGCPHPEALRDR